MMLRFAASKINPGTGWGTERDARGPLSVAPSCGAVRSSSIVLVLVLVLVIDSWLPASTKIEDDDEDDYEHDKDESRQAP
jgi:hypothetical protein